MLQWGIVLSIFISFWTPTKVDLIPKIQLKYQDQSWELPLEQVGFDGIDPTTINRKAFHQWLHEHVEKEINQPPISAHFKEGKLIPHQLGKIVDHEKIDEWLENVYLYLQKPVQVPIIYSKPLLTTKQVRRLKEKHISSYTTRFNPKNRNRSHNIYLSAKAIDHHILLPGQIFSFNQVVGQRTIQKGYRQAKVIVKGEYSEGIGGGICQTSSTLFNSVDRAGLEIIERVSHSKRVTYVPKKRDATVSWGGPDFRFKNQLNEPILIVSKVYGGSITISIYGPKTLLYPTNSSS